MTRKLILLLMVFHISLVALACQQRNRVPIRAETSESEAPPETD